MNRMEMTLTSANKDHYRYIKNHQINLTFTPLSPFSQLTPSCVTPNIYFIF